MLSKNPKVLVHESSAVMLRSRLVDKSNSNYPKYGLQVFVKENASVISQGGTAK